MRKIVLALCLVFVAAGPAAAAWRDDFEVLKVGFLAGDNPAYEVGRMEPFRQALQYGLAVKVELFPARSYQALIEAESSGRIQYAILSSTAYVALQQACSCAEPLVQPTTADGARGFHATLVTRADGPIHDLEDARGMRLAVGAKDSISGRIAPFSGLAGEGIEPDTYFARVFETENAAAALTALVDGQADVAVAWSFAGDPTSTAPGSGPIATLAEQRDGSMPPLKALWTSDLIPFGPHAIRTDLPPEARAALLDTLLNLKSRSPEVYDVVERQFSGGFVTADPADYRHFADMLNSLEVPQ